MEHEKRAEALFIGGQNCCQSVFLAFQDLVGLDEGTMLRLAAPFGGGFAGMRETCGAVTAMLMVMGQLTATEDYRDTQAKAALYKRMQRLAARFEAENGSHQCRELLGLLKGVRPEPSERTGEYYKVRPCVRLVKSAARILDEELENVVPESERAQERPGEGPA